MITSKTYQKDSQEVINKDSSDLYKEVVAANTLYACTYKAQPNAFSRKRAALLTCMDARLLPNEFMGFEAGDIHLIRNAGGRASDDAIRSLVISSRLLTTNQFFVVHHTDCGMQRFTNKSIHELLHDNVNVDEVTKIDYCNATLKVPTLSKRYACKKVRYCCGKKSCVNYQCIDWLTIQNGLFRSVLEDVKKIRQHPLIPAHIPIYGFIFDVMTGKLVPVSKAMKAGKAKSICCL
ncbi:MAG TPA: carbonic anhydrase [Candidatus Babeliales bacterium]|nr:carbonic anhydrase [Candidatus Babeliales bacterium]